MNSCGKHTYGTPILQWGSPCVTCTIGSFCSIGKNVNIYLGGNHRTDWITTYPFGHRSKDIFNTFNGDGHPSTKGSVFIGNDVWIADNVTIMSGVTIGDGAVIANNSHVVKDVPAYSVVGGNPATVLKYRFTPSQIEALLEIQWWNWNDDCINQHVPLLCSGMIDDFIQKFKK